MSWFGSSTRKTTIFYVVLIAMASLVVGMVIASRLDLSPTSSAQTLAIPSTNSAPLSGPVDATTFRNIAKAQSPMVVSIRTESRQRTQDLSEFFGGDDLLERFFGPGAGSRARADSRRRARRQQPRRLTQAAGSGFIINKDGFIITNNHVVEGASKIEVQFFDDERRVLRGEGRRTRSADRQRAAAARREAESRRCPEAKFGDSSQMEPGDWVMAIGNPFSLAHTVSVGVVSATSRPFPVAEQRSANVLQTDAAINPGQLGRTAAEPSRRSHRREHRDLQQRRRDGRRGQHRHRLRGSDQHDSRRAARTARRARSRAAVSASRCVRCRRTKSTRSSLKDRRGAMVAQVPPGPAATAGIEARRRHRRVQRQAGDAQRRSAADRGGHGAGHDGAGEGDSRRQGADVQRERRRAQISRPKTTRQADAGDPGGDTGAGFGITLNNVTPEMARQFELPANTRGAIVTDVDPDSPAARVLQPGDVILRGHPQAGRERDRGERRTSCGAVRTRGRHAHHAPRPGAVRDRAQGVRCVSSAS